MEFVYSAVGMLAVLIAYELGKRSARTEGPDAIRPEPAASGEIKKVR